MENYLRITGTKEQLDEAVLKLCGKKGVVKFKPSGAYLKQHPAIPETGVKEKSPVTFDPGFNDERLLAFKTVYMPPFMLSKGITKQLPDIEMEYAYMDRSRYHEVGHGFYKAGKTHNCEQKKFKASSPQLEPLYRSLLQKMKYN